MKNAKSSKVKSTVKDDQRGSAVRKGRSAPANSKKARGSVKRAVRLPLTDRIIRIDSEGYKVVKLQKSIEHSWGETAAAFNSRGFLIAGGRGEDGYLSASSYLIDLSYNATPVEPMPTPRARHAMVALKDGSFLVVGGVTQENDGSLCLAKEILRYEPSADRWHSFSHLPFGTSQHVAERVGDRLFVIAGDTGTNTEPEKRIAPARCRNEVQILDLDSGRWSQGSPKPTPETGVTSAVRGSEIYVVSSYEDDILTRKAIKAIVEVYDVDKNKWRVIAEMPTPRTGVPAGFINGSLYCVNGLGRRIRPLSLTEVYDPSNNRWKKLKSAPPACYSCGYVTVDNKMLFLFGGRR